MADLKRTIPLSPNVEDRRGEPPVIAQILEAMRAAYPEKPEPFSDGGQLAIEAGYFDVGNPEQEVYRSQLRTNFSPRMMISE